MHSMREREREREREKARQSREKERETVQWSARVKKGIQAREITISSREGETHMGWRCRDIDTDELDVIHTMH